MRLIFTLFYTFFGGGLVFQIVANLFTFTIFLPSGYQKNELKIAKF